MRAKAYDYATQINNILDRFDFDRVQQTMKAIGWRWSGPQGTFSPSYDQLKNDAREILFNVVNSPARSISKGGFMARKEDGHLYLAFIVSDWTGTVGELV